MPAPPIADPSLLTIEDLAYENQHNVIVSNGLAAARYHGLTENQALIWIVKELARHNEELLQRLVALDSLDLSRITIIPTKGGVQLD